MSDLKGSSKKVNNNKFKSKDLDNVVTMSNGPYMPYKKDVTSTEPFT